MSWQKEISLVHLYSVAVFPPNLPPECVTLKNIMDEEFTSGMEVSVIFTRQRSAHAVRVRRTSYAKADHTNPRASSDVIFIR